MGRDSLCKAYCMKVLVCWLLFFIVPLLYAAEELTWTPVNIPGLEISGSGENHLGLWFQGDFGWLNSGKQLWITRDAGRNWTLSLTAPEGRTFYDIYFINASEGWAVANLFPSFLFHTKDEGRTWKQVEYKLKQTSKKPEHSADNSLIRIYFKDALNGIGIFLIDRFPIRTKSIVARTEDGGWHWTEIARSGPFPQLIGFGDWVLVGKSHTPDFGESFQKISTPSELKPFFVTPSYGWAVDYYFVGNTIPSPLRRDVLKTTNGGHTWSEPIFSRTTEPEFAGGIRDLCLFSENVGAILWSGSSKLDMPPLLYLTYNGGIEWFSYEIPVQFKPLQSDYILSCNRHRHEIWLVPSFVSQGITTLFFASVATVTAVQPSSKLLSIWGAMKRIRKED